MANWRIPNDEIITEITAILTEDFDEFAEELILSFDALYPGTAVSLLTMPERKALIRHSCKRFIDAMRGDYRSLHYTRSFYPSAVDSTLASTEKGFMNCIENDFHKMMILVPFVEKRLRKTHAGQGEQELEKLCATAQWYLMQTFRVILKADTLEQLEVLRQRVVELIELELIEERQAMARETLECLRSESRLITNIINEAGRQPANRDIGRDAGRDACRQQTASEDASKLLIAEIKCLEAEVEQKLLELAGQTFASKDLHRRQRVEAFFRGGLAEAAGDSARGAAQTHAPTRAPGRANNDSFSDQRATPAAVAATLAAAGSTLPPDFSVLTQRESQIVSLVVDGLSNKAIATRMNIAENTAKNHLRRVFQKLGLHSRSQLAAFGAYKRASTIELPPLP